MSVGEPLLPTTPLVVARSPQIQELVDQIDAATGERDEKMKLKAKRADDEAGAKGELAQTQEDKAADEKCACAISAQYFRFYAKPWRRIDSSWKGPLDRLAVRPAECLDF